MCGGEGATGCGCGVFLISCRRGVLAVTGLLNISGPTVDMAGMETPTAHVINVATQCSCVCLCVCTFVFVSMSRCVVVVVV